MGYTLAGLCVKPLDYSRIAEDAGLDLRRIALAPLPIESWRAILEQAEEAGKIETLLAKASEQGEGEELLRIERLRVAYRDWAQAMKPLTLKERQLDLLASKYRLRPSWNGDLPVPMTLLNRLDDLLARHQAHFGGRDGALRSLHQFLHAPGGYLPVLAPAGFGKSALLARWIQELQAAGKQVCYTFINRAEGTADLQFTMQNLCEQMAGAHRLVGTLPALDRSLQALYPGLLQLPPDPGLELIVVLDGLDEALGWTPRSDLFPPGLPHGVHVVFSARQVPGVDWVEALGPAGRAEAPLELGAMVLEDVKSLLERAGGKASRLAARPGFAAAVVAASNGDPFYLHFLVEDIAAGAITARNIKHQPHGLEAYLTEWWRQLKAEVANLEEVTDLLGVLCVAKGRLLRQELQQISPSLGRGLLLDKGLTGKLSRYLTGDEQAGYAIAHPRFGEYLTGGNLFSQAEVDGYRTQLLKYCAGWQQSRSAYALTHYAAHLVDALPKAHPEDRDTALANLVSLAGKRAFQKAHLSVVGDLAALQGDLERVLGVAAGELRPQALPLVVQSALALVDWRARELRPEPLFALAHKGQIRAAERRVRLLDIDAEWQQAIRLLIAWLGQAKDAPAARTLLQAALPDQPAAEPLRSLWQWLHAVLDKAPPPPSELRETPPKHTVEAIVERFAGSGNPELLERGLAELMDEGLGVGGELMDPSIAAAAPNGRVGFLSERDSPLLVAYAHEYGEEGDPYLDQYIAIQSNYDYPQYRYQSLWFVLDAVVRHPDPEWVCRYVEKVATAALGGGQYRFREGLPIAVGALSASTRGEYGKLAQARKQAYDAAEPLTHSYGPSDIVGAHKRRLAAHAEALRCALGYPEDDSTCQELLARAEKVRFGYAGYGMPAYLALAEAASICLAAGADAVGRALDGARSSAHNINEPTYCARSTARCNAMRAWWWQPGGIADLPDVVRRLLADPQAPEFAAAHCVDEAYGERAKFRLDLPDAMRQAKSLVALAAVYKQPLTEFQRLNRDRDWDVEQPLDGETLVRVPDPGFVPLLAARFAAEALAQPGLPPAGRRVLIQSLVPLAAPDPTALDTVLARLVLADPPETKGYRAALKRLSAYPVDIKDPKTRPAGIPS